MKRKKLYNQQTPHYKKRKITASFSETSPHHQDFMGNPLSQYGRKRIATTGRKIKRNIQKKAKTFKNLPLKTKARNIGRNALKGAYNNVKKLGTAEIAGIAGSALGSAIGSTVPGAGTTAGVVAGGAIGHHVGKKVNNLTKSVNSAHRARKIQMKKGATKEEAIKYEHATRAKRIRRLGLNKKNTQNKNKEGLIAKVGHVGSYLSPQIASVNEAGVFKKLDRAVRRKAERMKRKGNILGMTPREALEHLRNKRRGNSATT